MEPISMTDGVRSHGVVPPWVVHLVAGLCTLEAMVGNIQVITQQQWWTLSLFVAELRGTLVSFMGCIGDLDHYQWMTSFSVPLDVQVAAPDEEDVVCANVSEAFMALRRWLETQDDSVVDTMSRKLCAITSLLDVGTDIEVKISVLDHILEVTEGASSLASVIRHERRHARLQNPAWHGQADSDVEPEDAEQPDADQHLPN